MNKKPVLPPRRKPTPIPVHLVDNDRIRVYGAYRRLGTWRAVGEEFKVKPQTAYRFVILGRLPRLAKDRAALGLPALASAPVCARCGVVPLAKRCPTCRRTARETAFERNGREYDAWRAAHAGELAADVEWAEGESVAK